MSSYKKVVLVVCSEEEIDYALKHGWTILVRKEYPKYIDRPFEVYFYCKKPYQRIMAKGEYAHNTICEFGGKNYYNWTIKNIEPLDKLERPTILYMENGLGGYIELWDTPRRWQYAYTYEENPR